VTEITDEFMKQMLAKTKNYTLVILREGPNKNNPDVEKIIWEHGRRNFFLRAEGLLPIVCPVRGEGNVNGIGVFNSSIEETKKIMDKDPGVMQGIFVYEIYTCLSFPGDCLS